MVKIITFFVAGLFALVPVVCLAAVEYKLDPADSAVVFHVFGSKSEANGYLDSECRGIFINYSGTLKVADSGKIEKVEIVIDMQNFEILGYGNDSYAACFEYLKGREMFGSTRAKNLAFKGYSASHVEDSNWKVDGRVNFAGLSQAANLLVQLGSKKSNSGNADFGEGRIDGSVELNLSSYGLGRSLGFDLHSMEIDLNITFAKPY